MGLLPERTARFEAFVAPARARPALWRLLAGAGLAIAVWVLGTAALLPLAPALPGDAGRLALVLYLLGFAALALGTALAARLLQRRGPATLIGPGGFRPRGFAAGVGVVALVAALSAAALLGLAPPVRQLPLATWAAWLPLALPALLIQTAAEEIAFRGYLLQGLAARFRSPLAWWLGPAVLFGLVHWSPADYGRDAWLAALSAGVIGLILADVTARTGNLSAAIGLHFANNAVALLLVAMPSPVAALGLWLTPLDPADPGQMRRLLLADLAATLLAWALWRALAARRRRLHSRTPGSI
jgi:membrane protease YdiL (CAAX protease family)